MTGKLDWSRRVGRALLLAVFCWSPSLLAQAVVIDQPFVEPYEGMWIPWFEPGSGLVIDQQDDTLIVTIFTYDDEGNPVWYLASGPIERGVFEAEALRFQNGACLNCEWQTAEPHSPETIRLEFIAHTLAWMTWRGEAVPIRTFPFDVPMYSSFGGDYPPFGGDEMYNMSGRWLFLSEHKPEDIRQTPTFDALVFLDPGGTAWSIDSEGPYQGYSMFCRDEDLYPQSGVPHCVYGERNLGSFEITDFPISFFWGDTASDRVIGYEDPLKVGTDGDLRGKSLVQGFRLTGPVERDGSQGFPAASATPAVYIEKGMWFNPEEPGSGLMLDWQDDTLVFAIFTYDTEGNAVWYVGSGRIEGNTVSSEASQFVGGTCLSCEYQDSQEAQEPIPVTFEFESKTTAWLNFDGGPAKPISAVPFDVPMLRTFGEQGDFGTPYLYDLRGEWVFVSTEGEDSFLRRLTFQDPSWARGGEVLAWNSAENDASFRCEARPDEWASPQCRLIVRKYDQWKRLFSAHWADVGEDQIIGYEGQPLSGEDGITRGEKLIFGFRLSGPGSRFPD